MFATLPFDRYFQQGLSEDVLMRIALAIAAGVLLGAERERHGRAAGLRTTLLVSLAACIAMIVSDGFYQNSVSDPGDRGGWHPDPARLAAGILAGMGFLGAGVIVHERDHVVRGVTTAATLWFVSIIGLAFGAGVIGVGLVATVASLVILSLVPYLESRIRSDWYSDLGVTFDPELCSVREICNALKPLGVRVKAIDLDEDMASANNRVLLHLKYKRRELVSHSEQLVGVIRKLPGVRQVSLKT